MERVPTSRYLIFAGAVIAGFALDIAGGVVTNATGSAKRWYHRRGQGFWEHLGFVSVHLLHILLVGSLYLGFDLEWILLASAFLLAAAAAILAVPQYLQRPVAHAGYALGVLVSLYLLDAPRGLEWFLPLLYLKVLLSHLVREEPYRPARAAAPPPASEPP